MARITIPTKETAPAQTKATLERYERNLGAIPDFFSLIARSPDVLNAEANMHAVQGKSLGHHTRERLHIMAAEVNGCNYCLSAHSYVGDKFNHLTTEEMELNRQGHSSDPKADAALQFGYKVAKSRSSRPVTAKRRRSRPAMAASAANAFWAVRQTVPPDRLRTSFKEISNVYDNYLSDRSGH
ncbi:MAG: hypothetical protein U0Q18_36650 [Bryobacteraceae bacterium]